MNEKIHGQFYLDEQVLEFIASVASFYNISRKKVQATPSRAHKAKATSPQNAPIQQLAFNFTAREAAEPFGANKSIFHKGQR